MKRMLVMVLTLVVSMMLPAPLAQVRAEVALRAAMELETVKGDLKAAIEAYRKIVDGYPNDRAVRAQALVKMAEAYQKLGDAQARPIYERVIREFADQAAAVGAAKSALGATEPEDKLAGRGRFVAREIWSGPDLMAIVAPGANVGFRVKPSTDGRWLAFVNRQSHWWGDVAIRNVATGETRMLTREAHGPSALGASHAETAFHPVLSPDGSQVAYQWASGEYSYSIRVKPVGDGPSRVLLRADLYASAIAWSPEGKQLAVIVQNARGGTDPHIALISTRDGAVTRLKSLPWNSNYRGTEPELGGFSPDGRFVLYAVSRELGPTQAGIFALAIDGTQEAALVKGSSNDRSPSWTPDGRAVVFVSDRSANDGIWSIAVQNGKPIGAPRLVRADTGTITGLGFAHDGSYFYGRMSARADAYAAGIDLSLPESISPPHLLIDRSVGSNRDAAWSPDGRRLAFIRSTPSGDTVVTRSADGTERTVPTPFHSGGYGFVVPTWFPDSQSLLIPEIDRSTRHTTVRQVRIDNAEPRILLEGPNWEMRRVTGPSPDGKSVYYSKGQESPDADGFETVRLVRRTLDSADETELYRAKFRPGSAFFSPAISPDADRVAFIAFNAKNERTLMVSSSDGRGAPREIAHGTMLPGPGDSEQTALWTKDGRFVLLACYDGDQKRRVWAFPTDGGEPRKLNVAMSQLRLTGISPDGTQFAFSGAEPTADLWMVTNLLANGAAK